MAIRGLNHTDQSIVQTCGYITDDKFVASYHGVSVERVKQVRKKMGKSHAPRIRQPEAGVAPVGEPLWNNDAERKAKKDAKEGSAQLLAALHKFFQNRERRLHDEAMAKYAAEVRA